MSGGFLKNGLAPGEHQIAIFVFKGPINSAKCREWNDAVFVLKDRIKNVIGATIDAHDTPGPDAFNAETIRMFGLSVKPRKKAPDPKAFTKKSKKKTLTKKQSKK